MDRGQTPQSDAGDAMKQFEQLSGRITRHIRSGFVSLALFGLVVGLSVTAWAATVTVQSDHLDIWEKKQEALFVGRVHLVREDFELFCDKLRAFYKNGKEGGGIDHALATGHVRMIQGEKKGTSDSAVIDNSRQIVTLRGNAVMEQEGGRVTGETIVHHLNSKSTEVLQGENGRVTLRIDDQKMDAADVQAGGEAVEPAPVEVPEDVSVQPEGNVEEMAEEKEPQP